MNGNQTWNTNGAVVASVLNILAGIWLIISPFVLGFSLMPAATWNTLIVGIVVLILAAIRAGYPLRNVGLSWINLLLGIWLIISPWVLSYRGSTTPVGNDVILGIIVGILGIASALATPYSARMTH